MRSQATSNILMVRPVNFTFNEETAASNAFQSKGDTSSAQTQALHEFDDFVEVLQKNGVSITIIEDTPKPYTPDSIFPNNWFSMHQNGTLILYPMQAENRRKERREDIIEKIDKSFYINRKIDLTVFEKEGKFLEGTGSMVLDRRYKTAYACISERTHPEVLLAFATQMNYELVQFHANDANGKAVYHTNVLMCIGDEFAVVCLDAIPDPDERLAVRASLEATRRQIVAISLEQMNNFAGNMLQVKNDRNEQLLVMSSRAYACLTPTQIDTLDDHCRLLYADLTTIENFGGGSARCMMAEVHLPKK